MPFFDLPEGQEIVTLADGTEYGLSGDWDHIDLYGSPQRLKVKQRDHAVDTPREELLKYADQIGVQS